MNPDSPLVRNFKTKEIAVRDFILAQFPGLSWICDKTVPDGCSLRRPDLSLDLGDHMLYLEIDEDEHRYGYTCQSKRLCELWQDARERPTVFIRFNPDGYTDENDVKVPSCWKRNNRGLCVIKDPVAWDDRLRALSKMVKHYIATIPEKSIEIVTLFFSTPKPDDDNLTSDEDETESNPNPDVGNLTSDEDDAESNPKRPKIA